MNAKYSGSFEKSQFGGFRAVTLNLEGKIVYLSQASWTTPEEATAAGQQYADALLSGIKDPRTHVTGSFR